MNEFDRILSERLAAIHEQGLYRELRCVESAQGPRIRIRGQSLLNFSSNDYLGLANEPALKEAAIEALNQYGAGAGASRLISGSLAPHQELDDTIAEFKGAEAALAFASGYAAALGVIGTLLGKEDVIVLDKLVHACIVDAARLSGAKMRVFAHNDLNNLEEILRWADKRLRNAKVGASRARVLIVTESVFSMDGDHAPLAEVVRLKEQYGAWLMVDEAHATGLYGEHRRGLAEECRLSERIEVQMGTLGKAIGAAGGYICGSRALTDYLVNRARTFIFSTAPVPAAAAAATAGVRFVQSTAGEERCQALWQRVTEIGPFLNAPRSNSPSAIIPILIGDETKAMEAASGLRQQGIFIPAIRYPTVARGSARLRLTFTAAHSKADVALLACALESLGVVARTSHLERSLDAQAR
jgi:8-amino-7-oxononanoate synthase